MIAPKPESPVVWQWTVPTWWHIHATEPLKAASPCSLDFRIEAGESTIPSICLFGS